MNEKRNFVFVSTLIIVIVSVLTSSALAQMEWDYCTISAYGTFAELPTEYGFAFITATPPTGSDIPNTIYVIKYSSGENYTNNLIPGDRVQVSILDANVDTMEFNPASEADHFTITFAGEARTATLNEQTIPEFSPILIAPLFMTATILAIIYRKKRSSQNQTTE